MSKTGPETASGVIFDCDGLLLDTESRWTLAEEELFSRRGKVFGPPEKRALLGSNLEAAGLMLERMLDEPGRADELSLELLTLAHRLVPGAEPMPGALDLLTELADSKPVGLASNSHRSLLDALIERAGMAHLFDAVVCGDEVAHPKPAPDLYIAVCGQLATSPGSTIALEDSPNGVAAARAAGVFVVGVPSYPGITLDADLVAPRLDHRDVRAVLGLS